MRNRNLILTAAIAMAMAAPVLHAQGRPGGGGGPPVGVGGGMGGPGGMTGRPGGPGGMGGMGAPGRTMGDSMSSGRMNSGRMPDSRGALEMRRAAGEERRAAAQARRMEKAGGPTQANENASFGLDTAARAQALRDADLETRKAFGAYQAELAQARGEGEVDVERIASNATAAEISAFAADTRARAREQRNADPDVRRAFGELQSALAREQALLRAAGLPTQATFGTETAARARLQGEADADTRTGFGADQSARARAKAGDDNDDGDDE